MKESLNILYLEDNPANAELVRARLESEGIKAEVTVVDTEDDFITALAKGGIDIILADYSLPSFDGMSAVRIVREKNPDIPFIFVTGALGEERAIETLKAGATDYVIKDRLSRLVPSVKRALQEVRERNERKKAEEALHESEKQYRNLFEESKEVIFISTLDGRFLDINPAGVKLFGYSSKEELLAADVEREIYLHRGYRASLWQTIESQGFLKDFEFMMRRKTGEIITVSVSASCMRDNEGNCVAYRGIMRDITEKKKFEAYLLKAQKMETVGQLIGGVAHDFNNILTAIIGYASLLKMKMREDNPLKRNAEQILVASDRAAKLTHSLLASCKKQVLHQQPVNVNALVLNIEELLLKLFGEHIELKTYLHDEDLMIIADPEQIEQVILNLATNARDAMPEGGLFIIETTQAEIDNEYIKTHGYGTTGNYALITITDTGVGMEERTKEKVFEPFFTTKEKGKSTGLGLSMVYGTIKQHNGYINVYSELGKGTTFKIYLPITEEKPIEVTKPTEPRMIIRGTEIILYAEDDAHVREFTKSVLEEFGYTIIDAVNGEDAIKKFMEHKDKIEILLLDVIMPKKDGREVYEEISKIKSDIKALFISGYIANTRDVEWALEKKLPVVLKPILPIELMRNIRKTLDT
ncbi:MAG: response regulator [Nitrospirota bacterium]|nr:response regulator [Nitrospirota bacterium]